MIKKKINLFKTKAVVKKIKKMKFINNQFLIYQNKKAILKKVKLSKKILKTKK